ncbi:hypothetical protein Tco_0967806 [Tanacetum coccineum]
MSDFARCLAGLFLKCYLMLHALPGPVWGCGISVSRAKVIVNQVMAALAIPISLDSSEESMGSHVPRVILFGTIPTSIPVVPAEVPIIPADPLVAPEVGAVSVISPTGVLDLVDYSSSSDSDPSEDSLPLAPELPLVLPFLCSDDSEADSESKPAEQRPERHESLTVHDAMVLRWRDRVAYRSSSSSGSSSYDTLAPSSEFPFAPVVAPSRILGPFPTRRLAWTCISHRSSDRHPLLDSASDTSFSGLSLGSSSDTSSGSPSDSLTNTSSVHSLGCDAPGQTHLGHSKRVASPRLVYPPVMTSRYSEAFRRWRSPTTLVPSSTPVLRLIAPTLAELLPPRKRFRDSYSLEDSREEHMKIGTADAEAVADLGIGDGVGAHTEDGIGIGVEITTNDIREDDKEFEAEANAVGTREILIDPLVTSGISESTRGDVPDLEDTIYDIVHYMLEVPLDRITKIKSLGRENLRVRALLCIERDQVDSLRHHMALSQEVFRQICRDRNDAQRRLRRTMTNTHSGMTLAAIEEMIKCRVTTALEAREANKNLRLRNGNDEGGNSNGDGNENGGGNGNENHNGNDKGARPIVRECTYQDFIKCQPLNFKGTEGVVGLIRWFEKMETVFHIINFLEKYQVKYATCALLNSALTWWNSHKRTIGTDAAFSMSWRELMKLIAEVYCPRIEIQKM